MSKIIVVIGPTASGKTSLGVYLAKKYNACIINADAEQVYKDVNIGTAKITKSEMGCVKHYLLDFVPLDKDFNVYEYQLVELGYILKHYYMIIILIKKQVT